EIGARAGEAQLRHAGWSRRGAHAKVSASLSRSPARYFAASFLNRSLVSESACPAASCATISRPRLPPTATAIDTFYGEIRSLATLPPAGTPPLFGLPALSCRTRHGYWLDCSLDFAPIKPVSSSTDTLRAVAARNQVLSNRTRSSG